MTIAAIIAEYNPFHNGHFYQLEKVRELTRADVILIMMSGDFVQRGGPACISKYTRCRMALAAGADIVCELPACGALASAEIFAASAVALLNQLGCIDYLCFGCETAHPEQLGHIARILAHEPADYQSYLKEALRTGKNFPAARSEAIGKYMQNHRLTDNNYHNDYASILSQPNNILAIEYMKALYKTGSRIRPVPIQRIGAGYHDQDAARTFSSATAIRRLLENDSEAASVRTICDTIAVPSGTRKLIKDYLDSFCLLTRNDFSEMLAYRLLEPNLDLMQFSDITEDLANRIDACRHQFQTTEQFIELLTAKNLTAARISRCLFHLLLGHTKELLHEWQSCDYSGYLRVLGFRQSASGFFSHVSGMARPHLMTRASRGETMLTGTGLKIFRADMYASAIYRQALQCRCQCQLPTVYSEPVIVIK